MTNKVQVMIEMETLEMDVDTAVPVGLIANELICNSLKYAFGGRDNGLIRIRLTKETDGFINFVISDNGVGKETGVTKGSGFGTELVFLLVRQLDGTITQHTDQGFQTLIKFSHFKTQHG